MKQFGFDPRIGLYNAVVNGNMDFWQRGVTATRTQAASNSGRIADRHVQDASTGTTKSVTCNRSTSVPTGTAFPVTYSLETVNNTALTLASSDFVVPCRHTVEGLVAAPLYGKDFTVGFYLYSTISGTLPITVRTPTFTFSYVTTVAVTSGWGYYSAIIPWHTSLATLDSTGAIELLIASAAGSGFNISSLNTWTSGSYMTHSSCTNWTATIGNTIRVAQVQMRPGQWSAADMQISFVRTGATIAQELVLCQRYFEKSYDVDTAPGTATFNGCSSNVADATQLFLSLGQPRFAAQKRAVPTVTLYNPSTGATGTAWNQNASSSIAASQFYAGLGAFSMAINNVSVTAQSTVDIHWTADADF